MLRVILSILCQMVVYQRKNVLLQIYDSWFNKFHTNLFKIASAIDRSILHLSSINITAVSLYGYVIYFSAELWNERAHISQFRQYWCQKNRIWLVQRQRRWHTHNSFNFVEISIIFPTQRGLKTILHLLITPPSDHTQMVKLSLKTRSALRMLVVIIFV